MSDAVEGAPTNWDWKAYSAPITISAEELKTGVSLLRDTPQSIYYSEIGVWPTTPWEPKTLGELLGPVPVAPLWPDTDDYDELWDPPTQAETDAAIIALNGMTPPSEWAGPQEPLPDGVTFVLSTALSTSIDIDPDVPPDTMYFMNTKYIAAVDEDYDRVWREPARMVRQRRRRGRR